jgi:hypothetical protein
VATTTQLALPARPSSPIALWHLLSLDAPTVAALWVCFIARAAHIHIPLAAPAAMALAVWILYAADRLLDARRSAAHELEARHLFHYRYRHAFLIGITAATAALATLLLHLDPAAIRLYLIEGTLLFAWFLILHATRSAHRLPKEIAVGLFFSAAVFIPSIAREPSLRATLLPAAILFAALCSLNCLFIYAWEHDHPSNTPAHRSTRFAIAHLAALAITTAVAGAGLTLLAPTPAKPIAAGCASAAVLLLALDRKRSRLSRIGQRAAADLALLTPLLLLPFLR